MDQLSILFAKVAALKKSFDTIEYKDHQTTGTIVEPLFSMFQDITTQLSEKLPELYSDLPYIQTPKKFGPGPRGGFYLKIDIDPLTKWLDYILEVRANSRIAENTFQREKGNSLFLSHGRSKEWYKLQVFLEKTLKHSTIELAQQPNLGRTVLQKLEEESNKCRSAIIVMTGDDKIENGETRARENVLHEIGFFQGKLGFNRIVLLHEEGVNIPSNIHGLVYISFPKDTLEATFGALQNELKVVMA